MHHITLNQKFSFRTPSGPAAARIMHSAESVPPDEFVEYNVFYLDNQGRLPGLRPDAYFTYSKDEDMYAILRDIRANLGNDSQLEGISLYIRPPPAPPLPVNPMDWEESSEEEVLTADDLLPEAPADARDDPAARDPGVPQHPDAGPVTPLQDHLELPQDLQDHMQNQVNTMLEPLLQFYENLGRSQEQALNEARGRLWFHLREMTPLQFREVKRRRQTGGPSASSSSTGQT